MKKQSLKTGTRRGSTAVVFPNWAVHSTDMFLHCARIPDVMLHIVKIRELLRRYKIPAPVYFFGLNPKRGSVDSLEPHASPTNIRNLQLMSFAVSLGLYDRFLRLRGAPDFLIGGSPALLVSAKIKNYEKTLIKMIYEKEQESDSIRVYQNQGRKSKDSMLMSSAFRFSLLYFSKTWGRDTWSHLIKEHKINNCISLTCALSAKQKVRSSQAFLVQSLIETDPQLNWFWPLLKKRPLKGKVISPTFPLQTGFH